MNDHRIEAPEQPAAHRVYGGVIYWVSIVAGLICTVGPFVAVMFPENNVLNPHYLFYAIWQGKTPQQVWKETGGGFPGAHFWLNNLVRADGIIQLGMVLGCSSAGIAFVAAAFAYLKKRNRETGWAILVLVNAAIILFAVLGIIQLGE